MFGHPTCKTIRKVKNWKKYLKKSTLCSMAKCLKNYKLGFHWICCEYSCSLLIPCFLVTLWHVPQCCHLAKSSICTQTLLGWLLRNLLSTSFTPFQWPLSIFYAWENFPPAPTTGQLKKSNERLKSKISGILFVPCHAAILWDVLNIPAYTVALDLVKDPPI